MTKRAGQRSKGALARQPGLERTVAVKRRLARLVLGAEAVLPLVLGPLSVLALFLAFAWFGLFHPLPDLLRIGGVLAFAALLVVSLLPLFRLRLPTAKDADEALERRNGLEHQPVAVQEDEPAFDTPFARALWDEHQTRMAKTIAALKAGYPRPDIAGRDRHGLRALPALLLVIAFAYSLSGNGGRIGDAFERQPEAVAANPGLRIDAWVTPPGYTGRPPIYLTAEGATQDRLAVPQFSQLTVRLSGAGERDRLAFRPEGGEAKALEPVDDASRPDTAAGAAESPDQTKAAASFGLKLSESGRLEVGGRNWSLDIQPDKAPEIAFDGLPHQTVTGALEIGFRVKDDYGVEKATAEILPLDADTEARPLYPLPDFPLDVPRRNARDAKGVGSKNLTEHPLSGKRVRITLEARDAAGQIGRSPPFEMVLPARPFNEPLAAAVAEERQTFALDTRAMPEAIALNEALTIRPEETIPKLSHYLLIESARRRMALSRSDEEMKDTADYLWQIALGIEDGDLSDAERALRNAQQKLSDALKRNAPDPEIKQAMEELRKAMQNYMRELAQRMQNAPSQQQNMAARKLLRQQDIERMMDQIENLARSGNKDAAQQMLSDLQRLMNNLQAGRPQQGQQQQGDNSQMREQMNKLGQILNDQQKLMDETFKLDQKLKERMQLGDPQLGENDPLLEGMPPMNEEQGQQDPGGEQGQQQSQQGQQGQQGQQPGGNPLDQMTQEQLRDALKKLRQRQDQLGKQLGELQKGLSGMGMKPGAGFPQAQREMEGAGRDLGQAQSDPALKGQGRAMEALRNGARDMMNQMMQAQQGQGQGQGQRGLNGQVGQGDQNGRDPLGRERDMNAPGMDSQVKIPDEADVQRAREILDAIREKLGSNPPQLLERQYLERLLDLQ